MSSGLQPALGARATSFQARRRNTADGFSPSRVLGEILGVADLSSMTDPVRVELRRRVGSHLEEFLALAGETQPEVFFHGLLNLGVRLEGSEHLEVAAAVYQHLQTSSPLGIQHRARQRLDTIMGVGPAGARAEFLLRRVAREALEPTTLFGMGVAAGAFRVGRLTTLARLLAAPGSNFLTRGFGARAVAGIAGFGLEATVFPLATRLGHVALGRELDWSAGQLGREVVSSFIVLGALKLAGWGAHGLIHFSSPRSIWRSVFPQAGMLGGIMLGHRLEEAVGLRPHLDGATTLVDSLAMLLQFNVAGHLANRAMGEQSHRWNRELHAVGAGLDPARGRDFVLDALSYAGPQRGRGQAPPLQGHPAVASARPPQISTVLMMESRGGGKGSTPGVTPETEQIAGELSELVKRLATEVEKNLDEEVPKYPLGKDQRAAAASGYLYGHQIYKRQASSIAEMESLYRDRFRDFPISELPIDPALVMPEKTLHIETPQGRLIVNFREMIFAGERLLHVQEWHAQDGVLFPLHEDVRPLKKQLPAYVLFPNSLALDPAGRRILMDYDSEAAARMEGLERQLRRNRRLLPRASKGELLRGRAEDHLVDQVWHEQLWRMAEVVGGKVSRHGASRLLEPFLAGEPPLAPDILQQAIDRLPADRHGEATQVLEIEFPFKDLYFGKSVPKFSISELSVKLRLVEENLPNSVHLVDVSPNREKLVIRIPSLSLFERLFQVVYPEQGIQFHFVHGEISRHQLIRLKAMNVEPIGFSRNPLTLGDLESEVPPWFFTFHDLYHAAIAAKLAPSFRRFLGALYSDVRQQLRPKFPLAEEHLDRLADMVTTDRDDPNQERFFRFTLHSTWESLEREQTGRLLTRSRFLEYRNFPEAYRKFLGERQIDDPEWVEWNRALSNAVDEYLKDFDNLVLQAIRGS